MQTAPSTASCSGGQAPLSPLESPSAAAAPAEEDEDEVAHADEDDAVALEAAQLAAVLGAAAVAPTISAAVAGMGGERVVGGSTGDSAPMSENQRWMLTLPPPSASATAAELALDAYSS